MTSAAGFFRTRAWGVGVAVFLALGGLAQAEIVVHIGDLSLTPGETGFVDVTITGAGENLQAFGFEFQIAPIATSGGGVLQFVNPQSETYLDDASYVFKDDSDDRILGFPVGVVDGSGEVFTGGDGSNTAADHGITGSTLLTRLQVTSNLVPQPVVGDAFQIALVSTGSSFYGPDVTSLFFTASGTGTVTLSGPAALTPEPKDWVALLSGGMTLLGLLWIRRRRCNSAVPAHGS